MPLNLSPIQKFIEGEMVDEIFITRDVEGSGDDTFDPSTGTTTHPSPDTTTVYEGKGLLIPVSPVAVETLEGGQELHDIYYTLMVPLEGEEIFKAWDKVTVTDSRRDVLLPSQEWWVEDIIYTTFAVMREMRVVNRDKRYYP